ncbi:MAG: zinc ribbon domain-containing protein [Candidatus Omnitrophota bacterium]
MPEDFFDYNQEIEQKDELDFDNLVQCPHCKKPIPQDAISCYYCGKPVDLSEKPSWIYWVIFIVIVALVYYFIKVGGSYGNN